MKFEQLLIIGPSGIEIDVKNDEIIAWQYL